MISCSVRHTRQPHQWEGSLHGHRIQVRGQLWMQVRNVTMMMRMVALTVIEKTQKTRLSWSLLSPSIPPSLDHLWPIQVRIHDHRRRHKDLRRGSVGIIILIIKEIKSIFDRNMNIIIILIMIVMSQPMDGQRTRVQRNQLWSSRRGPVSCTIAILIFIIIIIIMIIPFNVSNSS